MARVLLTGGAGYIGSHTAVALIERGHEVVILDNFANAERDVPARLERLTGRANIQVIEADIRDTPAVRAALAAHPVEAVIHFAALKAVGESEADPLLYYDMNIIGTIRLLQAMQAQNVRRIVFSSSATVYGQPDSSPILEDAPTRVQNIYGRTKLVMEDLISDLARTGKLQSAANLRYFNPVGAHPSAMIGETPRAVLVALEPGQGVWLTRRARISTSSAMTMKPPTAPACATISISSISPAPMPWRWSISARTTLHSPSISAPAPAFRCWTSSAPSSAPPAAPSPSTSPPAAPAMSRAITPTRRWPRACSAGGPSWT
jgi:putative NADH-flavin reductase